MKSRKSLNPNLIESFISKTAGGRSAGIALLREYIFYTNTGIWPDHLINRSWRIFSEENDNLTWRPVLPDDQPKTKGGKRNDKEFKT